MTGRRDVPIMMFAAFRLFDERPCALTPCLNSDWLPQFGKTLPTIVGPEHPAWMYTIEHGNFISPILVSRCGCR